MLCQVQHIIHIHKLSQYKGLLCILKKGKETIHQLKIRLGQFSNDSEGSPCSKKEAKQSSLGILDL